MSAASSTTDSPTPQAVDVDTFLDVIFEDVPPEQGVVGVSYPHKTDPKGGWRHRRWIKGQPPLDPRQYYFPTTLMPVGARDTRLRATEDRRGWCYCIVLDDLVDELRETKKFQVLRSKVQLTPSYVLETSSGNYQYGYILKEAVPVREADAIVMGLVAKGLTDGGRTNRSAHLMRVPGSSNVKHNPPFIARLVEWRPRLMYSLAEVANGLDAQAVTVPEPFDGKALVKGESDPVMTWLVNRGLILGEPNTGGWYPIECPWAQEHTSPGGTDYHPGKPGHFHCLHTHCIAAGRTTPVFLSWVAAQDPEADVGDVPRALQVRVGERLKALTTGKPGGPPPPDGMSLREAMAAALGGVTLLPANLPDADMTSGGKVAVRQTVTEVRVEHVLGRIGATVRHNAMTGSTEVEMGAYTSVDEPSGALAGTIFHACVRCGMTNNMAVDKAQANIAKANMYHPVEDWIASQSWDGTDRFEALVKTLTLADEGDLKWAKVILRKWLVQGATAIGNYRRANPVSVPYVLVLQGPERRGKSKWVNSLLPAPWVLGGVTLDLGGFGERDSARKATRQPITELGELDASFKRSEQSSLKNFLSTTRDVYRDAYGHKETNRPRCTVFAATVNPKEFLIGQEGETRFWPLQIEGCDWEHTIDLQQLWAQAAFYAARGDTFELTVAERVMHDDAVKTFAVESDVNIMMGDVMYRAKWLPKETWKHISAKDLVTHFGFQSRMTTFIDLNSALRREKFKETTIKGKKGFYLPPQGVEVPDAVREHFTAIEGGKAKEGGNGGKLKSAINPAINPEKRN